MVYYLRTIIFKLDGKIVHLKREAALGAEETEGEGEEAEKEGVEISC